MKEIWIKCPIKSCDVFRHRGRVCNLCGDEPKPEDVELTEIEAIKLDEIVENQVDYLKEREEPLYSY